MIAPPCSRTHQRLRAVPVVGGFDGCLPDPRQAPEPTQNLATRLIRILLGLICASVTIGLLLTMPS